MASPLGQWVPPSQSVRVGGTEGEASGEVG